MECSATAYAARLGGPVASVESDGVRFARVSLLPGEHNIELTTQNVIAYEAVFFKSTLLYKFVKSILYKTDCAHKCFVDI